MPYSLAQLAGAFLGAVVVWVHYGPALGVDNRQGPVLVGCLVWGIGLSLGGTTGYAINPARDLGPRLAHAVLPIPGKRDSDWSHAVIPVVGPLIGAALAGLGIATVGF